MRQVVFSVAIALLLITSGCLGFFSDSGGSNDAETPTQTITSGQQNNSSASSDSAPSTDLRSMSIPDNGSVTASGELDRDDPKSGGKYYEPIQIAASRGDVVNVTMRAEGDARPAIRVIDPDGNVSVTVNNESGNATGFFNAGYSQTGRYIFRATSVDQNATFDYDFTIEQTERPDESTKDRELFEGDLSEWNETERYLEFTRDFGNAVGDSASDLGTFPDTQNAIREGKITANASGDYAVYTYEVSSDLNFTQRNRIAVIQRVVYASADETYREDLANDGTNTEDGSWVPEIIFLRAVDEDTGELRRTAFLTREWARDFAEADDKEEAIKIFGGNYYATVRYGPGHESYDADAPGAITESEFPQTYWDWEYPDNTTLAEKYDLDE